MEKVLRPKRLDVNLNTVDIPRQGRHWLATFENFIKNLKRLKKNLYKLQILINFISHEIYKLLYAFLFCHGRGNIKLGLLK